MKKILTFFLGLVLLEGCMVDTSKQTELENRIKELEIEIDDCANGSDKLLAKIQVAYNDENFDEVKDLYALLESRHPESAEYVEAKKLHAVIIEREEKEREEKIRLEKKERDEKLASLNKLKKNVDDVSGITWYRNPYFTHYSNSNLTSIYMGVKNGQKYLRLIMSYKGDNWIFFKNAFLSYDGNTKEILFNEYQEKKTENEAGGVWEWIDVQVDNSLITFLKEFANSKNAKMRLSGKYSETRTLSYNERQGILAVLNGYEALGF